MAHFTSGSTSIRIARSPEAIRVAVGSEQITTGISFSVGPNAPVTADPACFVAGTRLDTPDGPVAVETLRPGMPVLTARGEARTVRWIGRRHLNLRRLPDPEAARPVRVLAGAIGPGVPRSHVSLSPDHAVLIDSGLVPVRLLVNGSTIRRDTDCRFATYYHVELDTHDILLTEGMPAESYLDTGGRHVFDNADGPTVLHPPFGAIDVRRSAGSCAPFIADPDRLEAIWRRIAKRAAALGHAGPETVTDPLPRVERDGKPLQVAMMGAERRVVVVPAGDSKLRLLSRTASPHGLRPWIGDRRQLGILVRRLTVQHADGSETIPLDHPALQAGWWQAERHGPEYPVRWTNGDARIPLALTRPALLTIDFRPLFGYGAEVSRAA